MPHRLDGCRIPAAGAFNSSAGQHRRQSHALMTATLAAIITVLGLHTPLNPAWGAELIMFETPSCHYCQQWHAELGPIYPKTAESKIAPLRRVGLHDRWPEDLQDLRAVSFTPTFVLIEDGAEVGRITGYAGDELFWFQLGALLEKLPKEQPEEQPDGGS